MRGIVTLIFETECYFETKDSHIPCSIYLYHVRTAEVNETKTNLTVPSFSVQIKRRTGLLLTTLQLIKCNSSLFLS